MINWIKQNFGPEARLNRLARSVKRQEEAAFYAEQEIPLLEKKNKALETLNKKRKIQESIKQKQFNGTNNNSFGSNFKKFSDTKSSFETKTPMDRVYGKN